MSRVIKILKANKLLFVVFLLYIGLLLVKRPLALSAFQNSIYYFKEMLIIMPVIMLLTALLEAWVPKSMIEKNLGKNSGMKGSIFAFLLGSFSAGPVYAAFPVCVALLKKGASIGNIVILLSTWAVIKLPMLANEAKFLGPQFMIVRWVLTTIAIFIIGFLSSKWIKREDVMKLHPESVVTEGLLIQEDYCIGCGLCAKISPEHFAMKDGKAFVSAQPILPAEEDKEHNHLQQAIGRCPAKIISFSQHVEVEVK